MGIPDYANEALDRPRKPKLGRTLKQGAKRAVKAKNIERAIDAAMDQYMKEDGSLLSAVGKGVGEVAGSFVGLDAGQRRNVKNIARKGAKTYIPILADAAVQKLFSGDGKKKSRQRAITNVD